MAGARRKWTPDVLERAADLIRSGLSVARAAQAMGASEWTLSDAMYRNGIHVTDLRAGSHAGHHRPWTEFDVEILRREHSYGASDPEIGLQLKRTAYSVRSKRKQLHLDSNGPSKLVEDLPEGPEERPNTVALRRCLGGCGQMFLSCGPGNRICGACSVTEPFRSPITYYGVCA